jgi:hypothetical protein
MNPADPTEIPKMKMDALISQCPLAFRSTGWHSTLRVIYFILGLVALVSCIVKIAMCTGEYMVRQSVIDHIRETASEQTAFTELLNDLNESVASLWADNLVSGFILFILSISLFLLARNCRKIIKRNRYIIDVNGLWTSMQPRK